MKDKRNRPRNNIFINPPPLPLSCEIFGALHLAQLGVTAGWQTKYRLAVGQNIRVFALFNQDTASLQPDQCIPADFFRYNLLEG